MLSAAPRGGEDGAGRVRGAFGREDAWAGHEQIADFVPAD
jgi:hypothetical protein